MRGKQINKEIMNKQKNEAIIEDSTTIIEEVETEQIKAQKEQKEILTKGQELWDKDIIDFYHSKLQNNTEAEKKRRKKIIQKIKCKKQRNHSFWYLTKHIGQGANTVLKRLHEVDQQNKI